MDQIYDTTDKHTHNDNKNQILTSLESNLRYSYTTNGPKDRTRSTKHI